MRLPRLGWTVALTLAFATPVAAQETEVARRTFTFVNNDLTIEVLGRSPGELHLIRGQAGQIEVAARTDDGIAGFGLAGEARDRLKLTAVGGDRVTFLVVVPTDLRVRVELPEQPVAEIFGSLDQAATYSWLGAGATPRPGPAAPPPEAATPSAAGLFEEGLYVSYGRLRAPAMVSIRDASPMRTVAVRWEGKEFRVAGNHRVDVLTRGTEALEVYAERLSTDLVLTVPAATREFVLHIGGAPAFVLSEGRAAALCSPVIDQRLEGGRRWFTFTPENGKLTCRGRGAAVPARQAD
ncbi:MAG TPA: hypothetical protein VF192_13980 [Longimicrobiales bacterium]